MTAGFNVPKLQLGYEACRVLDSFELIPTSARISTPGHRHQKLGKDWTHVPGLSSTMHWRATHPAPQEVVNSILHLMASNCAGLALSSVQPCHTCILAQVKTKEDQQLAVYDTAHNKMHILSLANCCFVPTFTALRKLHCKQLPMGQQSSFHMCPEQLHNWNQWQCADTEHFWSPICDYAIPDDARHCNSGFSLFRLGKNWNQPDEGKPKKKRNVFVFHFLLKSVDIKGHQLPPLWLVQ